ncbi:5'-AMP-activated protein kinase-like protein isoform X2 [Tasmannia lanceolata]|uniref:5'-AMP-activated protein kinase-like protein isoform X2 n=1 Tax=Tasmannia lanceolata TaxID=3420 RepID=UPI004063A6B2
MALCHFSSFSCISHRLSYFVGPFLKVEEQPKWETLQIPSCRNLIIACSSNNSRESKKSRTRPIKSNEELCNDLKEFISMNGLPENRAPSLKELSKHGRKDLANIVRRRGYKLIAELLMNPIKVENNTERNSDENQDVSSSCENESSEDHGKQMNGLSEDAFFSAKASMVEMHFSSANDVLTNSGIQIYESVESSISPSLHEMAANFIRNGELDIVEGASGEYRSVSNGKPTGEAIGNNTYSNLNETSVTSGQAALPSMEHHPHRDSLPSEGPNSEDVAFKVGSTNDNQINIDRLKAMLHQKELELSQLKQQIESEKLALSFLQSKANNEIGNSQKIISAKDAELQAVEESLSGLKEVQIEYLGNGEIVEVAGSFNGWHHPIKMDLNPSSKMIKPTMSRKSSLWSVVLWLYPGIYEIKFIVDGHWRIDPKRELITRDNIQNNILRVSR